MTDRCKDCGKELPPKTGYLYIEEPDQCRECWEKEKGILSKESEYKQRLIEVLQACDRYEDQDIGKIKETLGIHWVVDVKKRERHPEKDNLRILHFRHVGNLVERQVVHDGNDSWVVMEFERSGDYRADVRAVVIPLEPLKMVE